MKKIFICTLILIFAVIFLLSIVAAHPQRQDNIIIFGEDIGWTIDEDYPHLNGFSTSFIFDPLYIF